MPSTIPLGGDDDRLARAWLTLALAYFVGAVALGIAMAGSHDFRLKGLHVHLNLLGWVSMALQGAICRLYPQLGGSRLARGQFLLYQLALPPMMVGLGGLLLGQPSFEPLVAAGSSGVGLAVLLFAVAVWRALWWTPRASARHLDQPQFAA